MLKLSNVSTHPVCSDPVCSKTASFRLSRPFTSLNPPLKITIILKMTVIRKNHHYLQIYMMTIIRKNCDYR